MSITRVDLPRDRACAPELKKAGGAIVNVSSMAGALGIGTSAPYVASKGAINALTLNVARMLAPDVRVNAVCPGLILSRWFANGVGEGGMELLKSQYERAVPLERASTPGDVADAVIWLIDGAASMMGELLWLDSGMHLGKGCLRVAPLLAVRRLDALGRVGGRRISRIGSCPGETLETKT